MSKQPPIIFAVDIENQRVSVNGRPWQPLAQGLRGAQTRCLLSKEEGHNGCCHQHLVLGNTKFDLGHDFNGEDGCKCPPNP
jgi:hypothetical protein